MYMYNANTLNVACELVSNKLSRSRTHHRVYPRLRKHKDQSFIVIIRVSIFTILLTLLLIDIIN